MIIINFLSKYYKLTDADINEIVIQMVDMINMDAKPTAIIQYLQSRLEFPSFDFVQQLSEKIMELYNYTRIWVLKGHTPNELFQEEKKHLRPLPPEPFKEQDKTDSNVIELRNYTKLEAMTRAHVEAEENTKSVVGNKML